MGRIVSDLPRQKPVPVVDYQMLSSEPEVRLSGVRRALVFFVLWTVVGLSFAGQFFISSSKAGVPVTWGRAVSWSLGDWYVFALLSIPASMVARRWPIERGAWLTRGLGHLGASLLFSAAYVTLRALVGQVQGHLSGRPTAFSEAFVPLAVKTWHFNLLIYWVIVSVVHALENSRKFQERERQSVELERGLVQARLQALQMQLNPHFLFNALHSVSALMHKDVDAADRMIARLGDLLRYSLESSDEQEVPLGRELEILELYLDIEQTRFGSRLSTRFEIADDVHEALVPNLILQPIVENSVRHGIEPSGKEGVILVSARRYGDELELVVQDNGVGWKQNSRDGVGMSNTRARLKTLHGELARVETEPAVPHGSCVKIRLPFRTR